MSLTFGFGCIYVFCVLFMKECMYCFSVCILHWFFLSHHHHLFQGVGTRGSVLAQTPISSLTSQRNSHFAIRESFAVHRSYMLLLPINSVLLSRKFRFFLFCCRVCSGLLDTGPRKFPGLASFQPRPYRVVQSHRLHEVTMFAKISAVLVRKVDKLY